MDHVSIKFGNNIEKGPLSSSGADNDLEGAKRRRTTIDECTKELDHASKCLRDHCQYSGCLKMKKVWKHFKICQQRTNKDAKCKVCDNVHALLNYHAKVCENGSCSIVHCQEIKNRFKEWQTAEHNFLNSLIRFRMTRVPTVEKKSSMDN